MINDYSGMLIGCGEKTSFGDSLFRFLEGLFQTVPEEAEGPGGWLPFIPVNQSGLGTAGISLQVIAKEPAAVFIFMAVNTEILPVASIGRIVVVISVPVVNRQQMSVGRIKGPAALGTDQSMDGQRSFPIPFIPGSFCISFQLPDEIFRGTARRRAAFRRHATFGAARSWTIRYFCHGKNRNGLSDAWFASLFRQGGFTTGSASIRRTKDPPECLHTSCRRCESRQ